jgi:RNA polymerase sigma-70 factor, ECF subfamily
MDKSDSQLVKEYLTGNEEAFSELLKKYLKPVYNFLFQLTNDRSALDDLTQITFIKSWKNINKFNSDKNFKTWIFTIAKNTAYDYFKRKKTIPFADFTDAEGNNKLENLVEDGPRLEDFPERADSVELLEKALAKIPGRYHLVLTMRYKNDLTLQEISEILNLPYNTVKSQHQRGLKALRQILLEM